MMSEPAKMPVSQKSSNSSNIKSIPFVLLWMLSFCNVWYVRQHMQYTYCTFNSNGQLLALSINKFFQRWKQKNIFIWFLPCYVEKLSLHEN